NGHGSRLGQKQRLSSSSKTCTVRIGRQAGNGKQFVSWIHQEDFCRAVQWLIVNDQASGIFNVCAPHPLTNAEMMCALRKALRVPFGLPAPKWLLELGAFFLRTETELVLKSRRVIPARLLNAGFQFRFETFENAVAHPSTLISPRPDA